LQPVHSSCLSTRKTDYFSRRNLPHLESPGRSYFVTFRLMASGLLAPAERSIVLNACLYWHPLKMNLHAVVIMPDHVHLLLTPKEKAPGEWVSLSELLQSIKRYSASQINKARDRAGTLWQDESFDRIMRDEKEFCETWEYIRNNPLAKELVLPAEQYAWYWDETMQGHRLETCATNAAPALGSSPGQHHKLETCATNAAPAIDTSPAQGHRLETCATKALATDAACVFVKHNNACGVGVAGDPLDAYRRAYLGDPNAAMGGVLAVNFEVDAEFAATVMETFDRFGKPLKEAGAANTPGGFFLEVWVAPGFADEAVKIIRGTAGPSPTIPDPPKKPWGERVRLLAVGDMNVAPNPDALEYRSITGGMLVQTPDLAGLDEDQWRVVTQRAPTDSEMSDLRLAWLIAKHTKSNAISIVRDGQLVGNGAGQMSRVMSCRIAVWLARENGHLQSRDREGAGSDADARTHAARMAQSENKAARAEAPGAQEPLAHGRGFASPVAASDAFFPFRDGPEILMDAGVTAIIQPGGSKRDAEVIAACDERGVTMIFTGTRHFRH